MPALNDQEVSEQWQRAFAPGTSKYVLKAKDLPDRAERKAIFQALEDWYEAERLQVKALLDLAAGRILSNAEAKVYASSFLQWKSGKGG